MKLTVKNIYESTKPMIANGYARCIDGETYYINAHPSDVFELEQEIKDRIILSDKGNISNIKSAYIGPFLFHFMRTMDLEQGEWFISVNFKEEQ